MTRRNTPTFTIVCDRTWESLTPTRDRNVRHCDRCEHDVHRSETDADAHVLGAANRCIALVRPNRVVVGMLAAGDGMPDIGWLAIVSEAQRGRTIQLDSVRRTLGSSTAADLVIPDATITPVHAELERCAGGWLLRDLGGGVVANKRRVLTIELVDGDVIEVGATKLVFKSIL
jgi:Inner membrane component of T3SS, cytoplasmic domain